MIVKSVAIASTGNATQATTYAVTDAPPAVRLTDGAQIPVAIPSTPFVIGPYTMATPSAPQLRSRAAHERRAAFTRMNSPTTTAIASLTRPGRGASIDDW